MAQLSGSIQTELLFPLQGLLLPSSIIILPLGCSFQLQDLAPKPCLEPGS